MGNDKLEELLEQDSFVQWLSGTGSPEEDRYWESWMASNPRRDTLVDQAKNILVAFSNEHPVPDPQIELKKLNERIDNKGKKKGVIRKSRYYKPAGNTIGAIAAGIALLVTSLLGVVIFNTYFEDPVSTVSEKAAHEQKQTYETNYGEKLTLRLSDGSDIVLNANSNLQFASHTRNGVHTEVWLDGEAYFDIAHFEGERKRTFTVHTDNGSVEVLGTRFSVTTFRDQTQTVLEKGLVRVQVKEEDNEGSHYLLEAGEMAQFRAYDREISIVKVNTDIYTSWKDDKMTFDNTPMESVARRIEDLFGVEVLVHDSIKDQTLTGSITSGKLELLVVALEKILESKLELTENRLAIGFHKKDK